MQEQINRVLENDRDVIWAVTDIAYSDLAQVYSSAVVLAQKYSLEPTPDSYNEEKYHEMLVSDRALLDSKISQLKGLFDKLHIRNLIPPPVQQDEKSLIAVFSFKYAAVQAGLGWIGKNGVLVTEEFGPRVRLAVILVDYVFDYEKKIQLNKCGECRACVEACPWKAIKGVEWNPETLRDELIDFQLCNAQRSKYTVLKGRKHDCGYCIFACPIGK